MEFSTALKDYPEIRLQRGRDRRLLYGHKWVFSNEIDGPVKDFAPGSWVRVVSSKGAYLGLGYINPRSLIAVRIICPAGTRPSRDYFRRLIIDADARRKEIFPGCDCYRLFFSESDGLPGFIVDRYGDVLVAQVNTYGVSVMQDMLVEFLVDIFSPEAVVYRNDSAARVLEELPLEKGIAYGNLPDEHTVVLDGLVFLVDTLEGQKTGMYLDQRENRKILKHFVDGKRVLDLFCYDGAWSLYAARFGAKLVVGVDQSSKALDRARWNARKNGFQNICTFVEADVFDFLKANREKFDVIVCDPPAFVKNKKSLPQAVKGYTDLNRRAMLALATHGVLITCSCSYHLTEQMFHEVLMNASLASGRKFVVLETRGQSPDHPVLLPMPETRYLKCFVMKNV
ncbi:MAG TPA: class I SAM-dependent rRNA methyltransferase [Thermodesulforhabdus norvegica]|uniref:Class I SAM-dependent rRNA methyltransferase n=1 Tax=Thermodesulforhabdus norvegica TaxID=39841 RepID=A0A7C0WUU7_9BACT|nr:class I SAM-dependent rRNA methyltransferase [Thermodesulforhabdus norvegica]